MNPIEKLLFDLQTIGSIPKGRRITTAKEFINIEDESMLQPLWRTIARDSRDKSIEVVQKTIELVICFSDLMLESKYLYMEYGISIENMTESCDIVFGGAAPLQTERDKRIKKIKEIVALLDNARPGIENLCETYVDDANSVASLQPLMGKIDDHVNKISRVLIEMGEVVKKRFTVR
jgi:hypothetical protein